VSEIAPARLSKGEPTPFGAYGLREAGESGLERDVRVLATGNVTEGVLAVGSMLVGAFFRPGGVENADSEEFGFFCERPPPNWC
jgi:hypothetical protein